MRWQTHYGTQGTGHLYQGRCKTFPIKELDDLLSVLPYDVGQSLWPGFVAPVGACLPL
ncbi:MAG: hypothetical protein QGG71_14915 [Pirellulaceae bacterium]|nr:hypothetical protein [Pirellulaceae bacterium]